VTSSAGFRIYNAGFVVFTAASILLSFDPFDGGHGAMWLIGWRVLQAVGGSMLMANSAAILTDAFPADQRGFALGTNQIAGLAGMFVGLVAGGLLAAIDWRAVFWVNVPVGIYGTVWVKPSPASAPSPPPTSTRKARRGRAAYEIRHLGRGRARWPLAGKAAASAWAIRCARAA